MKKFGFEHKGNQKFKNPIIMNSDAPMAERMAAFVQELQEEIVTGLEVLETEACMNSNQKYSAIPKTKANGLCICIAISFSMANAKNGWLSIINCPPGSKIAKAFLKASVMELAIVIFATVVIDEGGNHSNITVF